MENLSVAALLAVRPNVGWLDLPIPPHSKLALFLDDEELETVAALTKLNILPFCMAERQWTWHVLDNTSESIEKLLENPMDYIYHKEDNIILSFGSNIIVYVEVVIGTVLSIYDSSVEADLKKALGEKMDSDNQRNAFANLIKRVRGKDFLLRAKLLSEIYNGG